MKYDCDVIRDLLPLYADKACSDKSRDMVEEHLRECSFCRDTASRLLDTEIEDALHSECETVIDYGVRRFRRRTAAVGSAVSGAVMIPILIVLGLQFFTGLSVSWVAVVFSALCVVGSLIVVPLTVREDKAFWTFCAFCASLMLLLGMTCLYSHGSWFPVASSAVLFGLSAVFLPFLIRARPAKQLIGEHDRLLVVLGVDAALFFNMLNMIDAGGRLTLNSLLYTLGVIGGMVCVGLAIVNSRKRDADDGK